MNQRELNIRRMADRLWEHYAVAGFANAISRGENAQVSALANTARATYKQFCERHNLPTGLTDRH